MDPKWRELNKKYVGGRSKPIITEELAPVDNPPEKSITFDIIIKNQDIRVKLAIILDTITENSPLIMRSIFKNKGIVYNEIIQYDNITTIDYTNNVNLLKYTNNIIKYEFAKTRDTKSLAERLYKNTKDVVIIKELDKSPFVEYWYDFLDHMNKKVDKKNIHLHERQKVIDAMLAAGFKQKELDHKEYENKVGVYCNMFEK